MTSPAPAAGPDLVERYFKAMQSGPDGVDVMVALFTDDGEYIEPFSGGGRPTSHQGAAAIRAFFQESLNGPLREGVRLTLERLDVDGDRLRSEWTCTMPMFPAPLKGFDLYT